MAGALPFSSSGVKGELGRAAGRRARAFSGRPEAGRAPDDTFKKPPNRTQRTRAPQKTSEADGSTRTKTPEAFPAAALEPPSAVGKGGKGAGPGPQPEACAAPGRRRRAAGRGAGGRRGARGGSSPLFLRLHLPQRRRRGAQRSRAMGGGAAGPRATAPGQQLRALFYALPPGESSFRTVEEVPDYVEKVRAPSLLPPAASFAAPSAHPARSCRLPFFRSHGRSRGTVSAEGHLS